MGKKKTGVSSSVASSMRFLIDVDDTLMVNNAGELVFNETLIDYLNKKNVKKISLLTKMDPARAAYNNPIRVALVNHLKKQGIEVERVLCPIELLFKETSAEPENYKLGSAYELYMKPLERAIFEVKKHITSEIFTKEFQRETLLKELATLQFLIDKGIIKKETTLKEFIQSTTTIPDQLRQFYSKDFQYPYGKNPNEPDFRLIDDLKTTFSSIFKGDESKNVSELIENRKKELQQFSQIPALSNKQKFLFDQYVQHFFSYRNLNYVTQFKAEELVHTNKQPEAILHPSKGDVYQLLVDSEQPEEDSYIFFIDDSKREHESLAGIHKYKHKLVTAFPPKHLGFNDKLCVDPTKFDETMKFDEILIELDKKNLIAELKRYVIMRKAEAKQHNLATHYNSFFGRRFGFNAQDKINAAEKEILRLEDKPFNDFTKNEAKALKANRLGKIVSKYSSLEAIRETSSPRPN